MNKSIQHSFRNLVEKKKVALVGNSSSLFDHKYGHQIDSHDVVIRMNKAAVFYDEDYSVSHGLRTDAWCFWAVGAFKKTVIEKEDLPERMVDSFYETNGIKKYQVSQNGYKMDTKRYINDTMPTENFRNLAKDLNEISTLPQKMQPSLGIAMAYWLSFSNTKYVSLYGFDWKKTPTFSEVDKFYNDMDGRWDTRCMHNFNAEEKHFHYNISRDKMTIIK